MFRNNFLSIVLMSLCMVLCVMFFSTLTVKAETSGTLKMEEDGIFYYYEGDQWISDKYGFVEFDGSKFLVANGVVATDKSGLAIDPDNESDWYFLSNGLAQTQYTGLVEYDGAWFYVSEGRLDTTINDYVKYDGGLFFVAVGRLVKEYQGLAKDPNGNDWYYVADGQAQIQYTGLAGYDGEWFYIEAGKLNEEFNGIVEYNNGYFKIADGMMVNQINVSYVQTVKEYNNGDKCLSYSIGIYNINNKLIEEIEYRPDDTISRKTYCNENGDTIKAEVYNTDGTHYVSYTAEYDGELHDSWAYYNEDGTLSSTYDAEYDENGRWTRINYTGRDEAYCMFEYDDENNIRYARYYDENNNRIGTEQIHQFNEYGDMIMEKYIKEDGSSATYLYLREYDSEGKILKEIFKKENGDVQSTYEYIYNSDGKLEKEICYDKDSNIIRWYNVYTYKYY